MNLKTIKSINGKTEYVLLPIHVYHVLREEIEETLKNQLNDHDNEYVPFDPSDYVDNPVALSRIKAGLNQKTLAKRMKVSQGYISKLESQEKVSAKALHKVKLALIQKKKT